MFSVLVIRLRRVRLLRVSGIVMHLRMFLLLITFLKASHSFRNRLLVICKNAYLFATMIMTSVSSPFSCCSGIVKIGQRRVGKDHLWHQRSYQQPGWGVSAGDGSQRGHGEQFPGDRLTAHYPVPHQCPVLVSGAWGGPGWGPPPLPPLNRA